MGCDIHLHVEIRVKPRKDSEAYWHKVDRSYTIPTWKGELKIRNDWYSHRNYNEFAILASVRNGVGFAGRPTGRGFVPLAEPKGMPDNASEEVSAESRKRDGDGHSHSWLTLKELVATPEYWDQRTQFQDDTETHSYRDCAKVLLGQLVADLQRLKDEYYVSMAFEGGSITDEDVRVVFWFDN